jgi:hypothetical protein
VDELTLGRSGLVSVREDADPIAHARPAKLRDREPDLDVLRKGQRVEINAAGSDDEGDRVAGLDVEQALFDQPSVHRAVEPLVEDRIVDVAVGVIVRPTGGEAAPHLEVRPRRRRLAAHQAAS